MSERVAALEAVDEDAVQTALGDQIATGVKPRLHTTWVTEIPDPPCDRN